MGLRAAAFFGICLLGSFAVGSSAHAGGLIGDFIAAVGNATGVTPLRDLGHNLDREHDTFKNHNPDYRRLEEEATRFARLPSNMVCVSAFEAIAQPVMANCNRFVSQSALETRQQQALIELATSQLIASGVLTQSDFDGVSISWCQGDFNGGGIAPNRNVVLLNRSLIEYPWSIAPTLAHEMKHIAQYRRMGTDDFKCDYAIKFAQCGGCQDRRHPLENEAFDFEEYATQKLEDSHILRSGVDVYPGYGPLNYQLDQMSVDIDTGEQTILFSGANPVAHANAKAACVDVRGVAKVSSGECIAQVDTLLAAAAIAAREEADNPDMPPIAEIREDLRTQLKEFCTPYPMRSNDFETDAYGRGGGGGGFAIPAARIDACVERAMRFVDGLPW